MGSGFGDDSLGRGGVITGAEGELGCSDVPGWGDGKQSSLLDKHIAKYGDKGIPSPRLNTKAPASQHSQDQERQSDSPDSTGKFKEEGAVARPNEDDGTDDHLHHPLLDSPLVQPGEPGQPAKHDVAKDGRAPAHADIQSLQESAEIAGKVVLLSRGGCGFLEKVKWVQRRGGLALIVGDDTRGGPLVTMYAHSDTSNVTIPALFTSYTTAHLLSSLIPPDGVSDDTISEDGAKAGVSEDRFKKVASKKKSERKAKGSVAGTTFTSTLVVNKPTGTLHPSNVPGSLNHGSSQPMDSLKNEKVKGSWIRSLRSNLGLGGGSTISSHQTDSRRPPSSGRINWILSENWADEPVRAFEKGPSKTDKASKKEKTTPKPALSAGSGDDFVIGVQDWRDPDLVDHGPKDSLGKWKNGVEAISATSSTTLAAVAGKQTSAIDPKKGKTLAGGSTTPGSGEYETPADQTSGWLTRLLSSNEDEDSTRTKQKAQDVYKKKIAPHFVEDLEFEDEEDVGSSSDHEGLWVTMTPTTVSTSPFFDTLLVLVVSPLVTLTIVYALLLLRSRIRRRRWRAPKSVVDRLPVRTYHTMSSSTHATTSQIVSPMGSSPSSPLLPPSPNSIKPRSRPRSRTTSGIAENVSASLDEATTRVLVTRGEKQPKKYSGKQVECVVCIEEYIDGQSRVMSLPCGHEFHAECM